MHYFRNMHWLANLSRSVKRRDLFCAFVLPFAALICASQPAAAQFTQQGPKLVGTGYVPGQPGLGTSVAVSADGNTMAVGGNSDGFNNGGTQVGAVWIFTRTNGVWSQQGSKLVGTGGTASGTNQGTFVGLSADGNTLMEGGYSDNSQVGAVWVFTRSGSTWTQQGGKLVPSDVIGAASMQAGAISADGNTLIFGGSNDNGVQGAAWIYARSGGVWTEQAKLVGTGAAGVPFQGSSVAISGDGNTAASGGPIDGSGGQFGAVWVFTRSGSTWTQQGNKLTATPSSGNFLRLGESVALSYDGNTLASGGPFDGYNSGDNSSTGATFVFTRSAGVWSQQGNRLVGTGGVGSMYQGVRVSLSDDGNTLIESGPSDNNNIGAGWVFVRSGSTWTQLGSKLVPSDSVNITRSDFSVAMSSDGRTAAVGLGYDNAGVGAAWVFVQPGFNAAATHDFNGDGTSDILSRDTNTGDVKLWLANGGVAFPGGTIANMATNWQIVAQRDFNGDGNADILWRDNTTGTVRLFLMNGLTVTQNLLVANNVASHFVIAGVGDFNGDGKADILWRDSNTGYVSMWFMNGATATAANVGSVPLTYSIIGTSPNGHILWRNNGSGALTEWVMNGAAVSQSHNLGTVPAPWAVVGSGDFDGNGSRDLLLRNGSTGEVQIWFTTNGSVSSVAKLGKPLAAYSIDLTGDFNGDGKSDIMWTHSSGARSIWFMNGGAVASTANLGTVATTIQIQSMNAE
jgi:hypothetical protein